MRFFAEVLDVAVALIGCHECGCPKSETRLQQRGGDPGVIRLTVSSELIKKSLKFFTPLLEGAL